MVFLSRDLYLCHRGAHRIYVERFGTKGVTRFFLRQSEIGLGRGDLHLLSMDLGAHDLGVVRRQRSRYPIETIPGTTADQINGRQRNIAGITVGDCTGRAHETHVKRQ